MKIIFTIAIGIVVLGFLTWCVSVLVLLRILSKGVIEWVKDLARNR